jgi:hypothetical protein
MLRSVGWNAATVGKLFDLVLPATRILPAESTATAVALSTPLPPRYEEKTRSPLAELIFVMKASVADAALVLT